MQIYISRSVTSSGPVYTRLLCNNELHLRPG